METETHIQAHAGIRADTAAAQPTKKARKRLSMHDGIAVWCDCCSCAAEPYWLAVAEEMGIDLGSDYEDEDPESAAKP
ncbi:MAG TPA: hypothetical protein VFO43_06290 [Thiobacillus sp.]|nr:hypothetical protein [Thiobacillus sp.]